MNWLRRLGEECSRDHTPLAIGMAMLIVGGLVADSVRWLGEPVQVTLFVIVYGVANGVIVAATHSKIG